MATADKAIQFVVSAAGSGPSWLSSMTVGIWYALNGSTPDLGLSVTPLASTIDPDPTNSQPYSAGGFTNVWTAWNSMIYVPTLGTRGSLIFWGGGHRDTYNNGIYRFDIETRVFSVLKAPSLAGPFSSGAALTNGQYLDGTPSPPHTYTFIQHDLGTNSLVCLKSISHIDAPDNGTSSSLAIAQMYSFTTNTWRRSAQFTSFSSVTSGMACRDTTRNLLYAVNHTNGAFARFDPNVDNGNGTFGTWTLFTNSGQQFSDDSCMDHDPVNDALVIGNFNPGTWYRKNPASLSTARTAITVSGLPAISDQSSLAYCAALSGMVLHEKSTGDVYRLTTGNNWSTATATLLTTSNNGKSFTVGNGGMYQRSRPVTYGSQAVQFCSLNPGAPVLAMRLA